MTPHLKLQIGSPLKILVWLIIIGCVIGGFSSPIWLAVALVLLLGGPLIAVPAMLAVRGRHIASSKSPGEIGQIVQAQFSQQKLGRNWEAQSNGNGKLSFALTSTKYDCEPVVSIDITDTGEGARHVSIWMSEWTSGGLNGGKGTPFWVWGGIRSLNQINTVARAIAPAPGVAR